MTVEKLIIGLIQALKDITPDAQVVVDFGGPDSEKVIKVARVKTKALKNSEGQEEMVVLLDFN